MEGSEISIHHAFYWQKCLITHHIKQDGQPGSASVQRKYAPFKLYTFLVQSMIELMMLKPRSFCELISVNRAKHCDRFMPGKLCGKYSVGSDAWCWANVCGGICRWRTCMSCFDPDGPGQFSADEGGGRRGFLFSPQVSLYFDIFTASLNLLYFFSTYTACSSLHTAWDLVFLLTSFYIPIPQLCHIPLSMGEIVYICGWMNDDFLSERLQQKYCRLWNNVPCSQTCIAFGENLFIRKSAPISCKSRGKSCAFLSRKLVQAHKIHCT